MLILTPEDYDRKLRTCALCASALAAKLVDPENSSETVKPKPIVRPLTQRAVMLIGQAPGLTEYRTNTPFSGSAGKEIRALFADCGFGPTQFEQQVFTSAVAKCFPGSKLTKRRRGEGYRREDLKPSAAMLNNCRPFLLAQIEFANPRIVVLLGSMALEAYLELRGREKNKSPLEDYVGRVEDWETRRVIPFAHTSGSSFWLNSPTNKALQAQAKRHLATELATLLK